MFVVCLFGVKITVRQFQEIVLQVMKFNCDKFKASIVPYVVSVKPYLACLLLFVLLQMNEGLSSSFMISRTPCPHFVFMPDCKYFPNMKKSLNQLCAVLSYDKRN